MSNLIEHVHYTTSVKISRDFPLTLLQAMMLLDNEYSNGNYLVGGCVRDMLLGIKPKDFDIVTKVHMDKVEEIFKDNGWKVDTAGKQFLVMIVSKDGDMYEIANFRTEHGFSDGRRPDKVKIGNMKTDSKRRDFTINALYYCPFRNVIRDFVGGMKDINSKTLKFVGKPKDRIKEDYLRVFRFYRFLKKGLKPDKRSLKACREMFNEAYEKTTPERVRNEIERMVL